MIVTDSGGLQKEAYWYGVPVRHACGRPPSGSTPSRPARTSSSTTTPTRSRGRGRARASPPTRRQLYGDGHASERIAAALYASRREPAPGTSPSSAPATSALPLAQTFADAGQRVLLVDVVPRARRRAQPRREPHRGRPVRRARAARRGGPDHARRSTTSSCSRRHAILIALPTPLTKQREPDLSLRRAAPRDAIAPCSSAGQLVVLESTTYPGTTREIVKPILEEGSGLEAGEDFHLAMSPERVDPGRTDWTTKTTPKVVGGLTPACTEAAAAVYRSAVDTVHDGLDARGGRADEAAREHLPLGQHRARQRARAALRPDGHRRLGGRRRRGDEAVRLHVVPARARASAATASRSTPSTSPGRRASTTSRRASSSSPARSTTTCRTSAARSSRRR